MKNNFKKMFYLLVIAIVSMAFAAPAFAGGGLAPNDGIKLFDGTTIPNTNQATDGDLNNVSNLRYLDAKGSPSLTGCEIKDVKSPNDDMEKALQALAKAADKGDSMEPSAQWLMNILEGDTCGAVYDGFAMLNYNHNVDSSGNVGEYKTGHLEKINGKWQVDVALLFYDGQIDGDTFLLRVPKDALAEGKAGAKFQINYTIYSAGAREEFAPTVILGEPPMPFKAFDSVWVPFGGGEIMKMTLAMPTLKNVRGIYTWGWRIHPPRIQFLQPIVEQAGATDAYRKVNTDAGLSPSEFPLNPAGLSWAVRNRELSLDGIGEAAPEKKMYRAAKQALDHPNSHGTVADMLRGDENGDWSDWADLAKNMRQLPPEAMTAAGVSKGDFKGSRMVSAYLNNEMYADGPAGPGIPGWDQGDRFGIKIVNLDNHVHYFRNVDFGPRLTGDIADCCKAGSHSFEVMNFKPTYGGPKVAEMQWRAGWGFRPHHDAKLQPDIFPRDSDHARLTPYNRGNGDTLEGYKYSTATGDNVFRFGPPPFIIGTEANPAANPLRDADGNPGLVIGKVTEGYGVAQMCGTSPGPFCPDIKDKHPTGTALNFPPPPGVAANKAANLLDNGNRPEEPVALRFPPFLRNPNRGAANAGDIIVPTPLWSPFLHISPDTGNLRGNDGLWWVNKTYAHGTPIGGGNTLNATIEAPRASAQVFYQFDPLFHDNAIFSPHPTSSRGSLLPADQRR